MCSPMMRNNKDKERKKGSLPCGVVAHDGVDGGAVNVPV